MKRKEDLSQKYATTFDELSKDCTLSPIVGLDMVSSEQVAAYLGVTSRELLAARTKCKSDLDALGVVSMNGRTAAARVPVAERVDGVTYKVPLRNGQSITIPSPPRVYYTAAGVARVKEELEWGTTKPTVPASAPSVSIRSNSTFPQSLDDVQIFDNPEFGQVRTLEENGKVLFCGKDVAKALGYKRPADAITAHCKGSVIRRLPTAGGEQSVKFVLEGDIYRLAAKSELPGADKFESWIFDEVIPSIRKHGAYMTPDTIESVLTDPDFIIRLATRLKDEQAKNKALTAKIEADQPKVDFADHISGYKGTISVGSLAKLLSKNGITIGRNKLYRWMRDEKILNQDNIPYQKYMDTGYFTVIETMKNGYPYQVTRVTGTGQLFLQKRFARSCRCS